MLFVFTWNKKRKLIVNQWKRFYIFIDIYFGINYVNYTRKRNRQYSSFLNK